MSSTSISLFKLETTRAAILHGSGHLSWQDLSASDTQTESQTPMRVSLFTEKGPAVAYDNLSQTSLRSNF